MPPKLIALVNKNKPVENVYLENAFIGKLIILNFMQCGRAFSVRC